MITHQSGEFNTLVRIEKFDTGQDTFGAPATTWGLVTTWWCRINPLTGNEAYANQAIEAKAQYKMDGTFIAGIDAKMRVNDHGVFYDITSPPLNWDNRSRFMTILAKTGIDRG